MTMASRHFITSGATPLLIRTLMESQMTSAAKHLPPEYSVSTSLCLLQLGGLEKIALCTAGDIITFIACGRAHLFPSPRERRERATIAAHAHLLCKSVGGWFRDSLSFLYSSLPFFSVEMLHPKLCSVDGSQPAPAQPKNKRG